jgi:hypothetical protein
MLSWHGGWNGIVGFNMVFIAILLDDTLVAQEDSPEAVFHQ